jgi:TonB-linked SusC/RagA family outer membrane protein
MPGYIPDEVEIDGDKYYVSPALGPHTVASTLEDKYRVGPVWNYFALANSGAVGINNSGSYDVNFALQYNIPFIKGLNVRGTYSRGQGSSANEGINEIYTLALYKYSNILGSHLYDDYNPANWQINDIVKGSRVTYGDNQSQNSQANAYINYANKFGLHEITAMASIERSDNSARSSQQIYEEPPIKPYGGTSATAGTLDLSNTEVTRTESGTMSYLGRVTYAYADKYLFNFIIRSDASTKFAPENYWGTFPSTSFGWVPSEEIWFKDNIHWIGFLKLRYSIGLTGKDNLKGWKWVQTYSWQGDKGYNFGTNGGSFGEAIKAGSSPNRKASWDKNLQKDIGIDASFLNGRLSLTYDYWHNKNYDMLKSRSAEIGTPISVGGGVAEENFAAINCWGHELSVGWNDNIGELSYGISVSTAFGYGNIIKKYVEAPKGLYPSDNTWREGRSTIFPDWGYKVWRGTSTGDGMLRTNKDINNYWAYLSENAIGAGTNTNYLGITDPAQMKKGMLAYQDLGGPMNPDGTQQGPNGQITKDQDYGKLNRISNDRGFSTKIKLAWKGISFYSTINTSWGGLAMIDRVGQKTDSDKVLWNRESFWADMYDEGVPTVDANGNTYYKYANTDGKYPNLGLKNVLETSDFWQVSTFRCVMRNLTIAYSIPKKLCEKVGINDFRLNITGDNLWDFYNPYPDKYRNMYDGSIAGYPTLRTWTFGVNVGF